MRKYRTVEYLQLLRPLEAQPNTSRAGLGEKSMTQFPIWLMFDVVYHQQGFSFTLACRRHAISISANTGMPLSSFCWEKLCSDLAGALSFCFVVLGFAIRFRSPHAHCARYYWSLSARANERIVKGMRYQDARQREPAHTPPRVRRHKQNCRSAQIYTRALNGKSIV